VNKLYKLNEEIFSEEVLLIVNGNNPFTLKEMDRVTFIETRDYERKKIYKAKLFLDFCLCGRGGCVMQGSKRKEY
jgi:hypothetical protein